MDIVLAVFLSLIAARLGYLGIRLTMYPPKTETEKGRYKKAFIALPLLATVLIIWQAVLTRKSQDENRLLLTQIKASIVDIGISKTSTNESPPSVNKPNAIRSHIHVTAVDLVAAAPGEVIQARTHFQNNGAAPITDLRNYIIMAVFPFSEDTKTQVRIEDSLFNAVKDVTRDLPIAPNQVPAHSISLNSDNHGIHPLTPELLEKVKEGEYAIYLVGRIVYKDSSILRHSDYCYWTKGNVNGMKLCFVHNEEP